MAKYDYSLGKGYVLIDAKTDGSLSVFRIDVGPCKDTHFIVKGFKLETDENGEDQINYEYLVFDDNGDVRLPTSKEKKVVVKCIDDFIDRLADHYEKKAKEIKGEP